MKLPTTITYEEAARRGASCLYLLEHHGRVTYVGQTRVGHLLMIRAWAHVREHRLRHGGVLRVILLGSPDYINAMEAARIRVGVAGGERLENVLHAVADVYSRPWPAVQVRVQKILTLLGERQGLTKREIAVEIGEPIDAALQRLLRTKQVWRRNVLRVGLQHRYYTAGTATAQRA